MSLSQMPWMGEKWRSRKKHHELKRQGCCHRVCILWAVGLWAWDCVLMTRIQFARAMIWKDRVPWGHRRGGASDTGREEQRTMKLSQRK